MQEVGWLEQPVVGFHLGAICEMLAKEYLGMGYHIPSILSNIVGSFNHLLQCSLRWWQLLICILLLAEQEPSHFLHGRDMG